MTIAIWLNLPDWLLVGQCVISEHAIWLGRGLIVNVSVLWY